MYKRQSPTTSAHSTEVVDLTGPTPTSRPENRGGDPSPLSAKAEPISHNASPVSAIAEPLVEAFQVQQNTPANQTREINTMGTPECPDSAASLHMSKVTEELFNSPLQYQRIPLPSHPISDKPFSEQPVYYAIAVGRNPGVYIHAPNAQLQIQRFTGAIWAICKSQKQAEGFIRIYNPENIPFMPDHGRGIKTPPPRFNAFAPDAHLTWPGPTPTSDFEEEDETSPHIHAYSSQLSLTPNGKDTDIRAPSKPSLKSIIAEAAQYGCYVPVVMNGKASIWHYDSGAALSQTHPDTLREMVTDIKHADSGGATFASAEAKSKVDLSLWSVSYKHLTLPTTPYV